MWATVPRLLGSHRYLVLATADASGRPWVTPVFYAPDGTDRLLWVSSPDSRHSHNLSLRPEVAITVFDSHAPVGEAEALYLEATAGLVNDLAQSAALERLNAALPPHQQLDVDEVGPESRLRIYQALIRQHHVLVRGGDPRFDNPVDSRLAVHGPNPTGSSGAT
jgi:nitroimidazol reductase NimA-like FMN-containing flavoprotein (pyridoxamine 5'-phosphate oxidase superfamily)